MAALCGLFYGSNKMATDVDVQYFSHLNGLTLGNNWGDLIRLLDKALVTGLDFTQITAASIDTQGDVHITLYTAHNAMLFQVVELTGFAPSSLNQKYRIKGVPNTTQLILKPALDIVERSITTIGTGKLASLGYDIIFRDAGDVKRVYRAKNPRTEHPFIRIDETISDGVNSYNSAYAKYAMVGLLEHMDHIDDYKNPDVLQLPYDSTDPAKNWKISGTGTEVLRGWSKWYWSVGYMNNDFIQEQIAPGAFNAAFTLCGDKDAFYCAPAAHNQVQKQLWGCGLYSDNMSLDAPWFLFAAQPNVAANTNFQFGYVTGGSVLVLNGIGHNFLVTSAEHSIAAHRVATPIVPDYFSGYTSIYDGTTIPALEIPFFDDSKRIRGSLKHIYYMGRPIGSSHTTPVFFDNAMYVKENLRQSENNQSGSCGIYFYLGELI